MEHEKLYPGQEALLYSHKIVQLSKALWKTVEKDWQNWIKPFDLNINEHHILWISHALGGASISEIAKYGVMHVSTAFNFSKKLEDRGLLTFSKKETDKRNTYVQLTPEGESLLLETIQAFRPEENGVFRASLPLQELYGKFPELTDISAIVRRLYGDSFMDIFAETSKMITEEADRRPQDPVIDSIKKA
ncbi:MULTISPECIES: HTH-type transcriptional regulator Hpr [Exiguobacterium]|jgi:MarR family protease production transcriptional regulator HPr|uniref:HTH-type transcriptional regulator Hpr n=2 Tax=Exiguobacterium TaxID=33986 RepID=HPR_EXIS2|nr:MULTISPECIES: HTH-type transcriptional regulator Hpr [Exiguobacterium]B1YK88.1 RecName: Full=HTH-type transcriptional regulator Hpr; AltName: Full=Protease production regulatory protein Hpr [Exiguobacterium sibiricum 255-15]ACB60169.1 transcriptional regulator, MarR family [Exiguobacterium sibiricum 255-15]MCK2158144.1 HTH-type transcriptional regulator Hpr [Exiguobacterium sp. 17-1]MCT4791942.1 HTH-type transcriptional regulator Hpr [Exiguobacterium artemiae]MDW2887079.1 HTH-type transcrip